MMMRGSAAREVLHVGSRDPRRGLYSLRDAFQESSRVGGVVTGGPLKRLLQTKQTELLATVAS